MAYESPCTDDRLLWDLHLSGYWLPSVLVADELRLFNALAAEPQDTGHLAATLKASHRGLEALLPMLASLGFLAHHGGRYCLTAPARDFLLPESPYYWGPVLQTFRAGRQTYERLLGTLRAPEGSSENADGPVGSWESGQLDAELAAGIARYMHSHSLAAAQGVARLGDFTGVNWLLDVGGGSGCFAIAIAQRHPQVRCTVMELGAMCALVPGYAREAGGVRVDTVTVDMFREAWPRGHDAVFLSNVLHDWSYATCAQLLARSAGSLPRGGRLYVHEMLLSENLDGPRTPAAFSLQMLLGTRGQQFTFTRLEALLREAGFTDVQVESTHAYYSLVRATKA